MISTKKKKKATIRWLLNTDWLKFLLYLEIAYLYRVQSLAFVNIFFKILYFANVKAVIILNFIYWNLSKIDLTERLFIWVVHKTFFLIAYFTKDFILFLCLPWLIQYIFVWQYVYTDVILIKDYRLVLYQIPIKNYNFRN